MAPPALYRELWEGFDRRYSFFVLKGTNWDSLGAVWDDGIGATTLPSTLFDVMTGLLGELEDPHVSLTGSGRSWRWSGWQERPGWFDPDVVDRNYLQELLHTGHMEYGLLREPHARIGYLRIPSFAGSGWGDEVDDVLDTLEGVEALVIDIRGNGGGDDSNGRTIAGRFADRRRLFRVVRYRDGPEHDDFGPPIEDYIEPSGSRSFDGPVVVLTNRHVLSSAEGFLLMMKAIPTVIAVGDTTGGASANPESRLLENGWRYTVSRWIVRTPAGDTFESVGLAPDVPVQGPVVDTDPILEEALEALQSPPSS